MITLSVWIVNNNLRTKINKYFIVTSDKNDVVVIVAFAFRHRMPLDKYS